MADLKKFLLDVIDSSHDWFIRRTYQITEEEGDWKPPQNTNTINYDVTHLVWSFQKYYNHIAEKPPEKYVFDYREYKNSLENMIPILEDQRDLMKDLIKSMSEEELQRPRIVLFKMGKTRLEWSVLQILMDYGLHMSDMVGHIATKQGMLKRKRGIGHTPPLGKIPEEYVNEIRSRIKK
ncbi:MAG: DinB family protein [Candidatus Ranarchaeia archaeon]|jgi:hypothetical protein